MAGSRPGWNVSSTGSRWANPLRRRPGKDGGKQIGRARAGYPGSGSRSRRRSDDQISVGQIQSGVAQAGHDANKPRVACRSAASEDQGPPASGADALCGVVPRLVLVPPRHL
jgi:hypothetical protein